MLCLTACISLMAQNISGKLVDEAQQPLPYANVVLQTVDSAFVTGTTTGEKGEFKLQKIVAGDYRLAISSIGYQSLYLSLQGFERTADVGTLTLADASQELPRLRVNSMDGSVGMTDGSSVQLCINGRKATKEEVTALLPEEVIRVEFQEDPGLRYGDAGAVINYIVRRYEVGGSFGYNGMQSLKSGFGNHNLTGKVNFKQSEISFYYGNRLQYFNEIWFDKNETFTFEDGSQYHRSQYAEANKKKNLQQWGAVTYNLQETDKYMLNATVGFSHYNDPDLRMKGKLYTEEFPNSVTDREEWNHDRNLSPYLDLYFQKNLKHKQFLALNVVGTYINTKNRSSYTELLSGEPVVDYYSGIRGKKYSLIGEGIYEKAFKDGG